MDLGRRSVAGLLPWRRREDGVWASLPSRVGAGVGFVGVRGVVGGVAVEVLLI